MGGKWTPVFGGSEREGGTTLPVGGKMGARTEQGSPFPRDPRSLRKVKGMGGGIPGPTLSSSDGPYPPFEDRQKTVHGPFMDPPPGSDRGRVTGLDPKP